MKKIISRPIIIILALLSLSCLICPSSVSAISTPTQGADFSKQAKLQSRLQTIQNEFKDMHIGVAVLYLSDRNGQKLTAMPGAALHADQPLPLASVFKVPIMIEAGRQLQKGTNDLTLRTPLTITATNKCVGSGELQNKPDGSQVSVEKAIELMITISDNTATDVLYSKLGRDNVTSLLEDLELKHSHIFMDNRTAWMLSLQMHPELQGKRPLQAAQYWEKLSYPQRQAMALETAEIHSKMTVSQLQQAEDRSAQNNTYAEDCRMAAAFDNTASPKDLALLLAGLWRRDILNERWSQYCLGVLGRQKYNNRLPKLLPPGTPAYHKTGTLAGIVNDVGIIRTRSGAYAAVAVLVSRVPQGGSSRAATAIAKVALAAYQD